MGAEEKKLDTFDTRIKKKEMQGVTKTQYALKLSKKKKKKKRKKKVVNDVTPKKNAFDITTTRKNLKIFLFLGVEEEKKNE